MKGIGCDKDQVANITGSRTHAQRLLIKRMFSEVENRDLIKDLKSELSGNFEKLVVGLYMEPGEYDAHLMKEAVDGIGFNRELLCEVLFTRLVFMNCLKHKIIICIEQIFGNIET